jgi:hypothetical protein
VGDIVGTARVDWAMLRVFLPWSGSGGDNRWDMPPCHHCSLAIEEKNYAIASPLRSLPTRRIKAYAIEEFANATDQAKTEAITQAEPLKELAQSANRAVNLVANGAANTAADQTAGEEADGGAKQEPKQEPI